VSPTPGMQADELKKFPCRVDKRSVNEQRLRAVICDDDPISCQVITTLAADSGYDVVAVTDVAAEAKAAVCAAQAHLLVLDLSLYGPPGHEVLPELQQAAPYCNVIIYTAFDPLGVRAHECGVVAVICKDQPHKLQAELQRLAAEHGGFVSQS